MKVCLICGAEIPLNSRATKYCSEPCRKRKKYEKDRAWFKANPGKSLEYSRKCWAVNSEKFKHRKREQYRRKALERILEERRLADNGKIQKQSSI